MPGFVKTKADEKLWSEAKADAGESYDVGSDAYWATANKVFHNKKKKHQGKTASDCTPSEGAQSLLLRISGLHPTR